MNDSIRTNELVTSDIIVGISTGFESGAISIIRLSGNKCIELVNNIFKGADLTKVKSHTIHYGHIVNKDEVIDEVLVSVFKSPRTYTTEDVVEINCHGGMFVTNTIYELCIMRGARPSLPGEFTKRAFLNGRIDLTKAEAVMDMISAENTSALKIASNGLQGYITDKVNELRKKLIDIIANISVNIDYPEYDDVEDLTSNMILPNVYSLKKELEDIINRSKSAVYLKNGIDTAIIGRPNVGKSSLLNALCEKQKAIVTEIPGTTRDIIEEKINLGSITLNLIDTAGIRETSDIVEEIGVNKSKEAIDSSELVILVIDGSCPLSADDLMLVSMVENKKHIIVVNKNDLKQEADLSCLDNYVVISTTSKEDIERVKEKIIETVKIEQITSKDITYISNARQIAKFKCALDEVIEALNEINDGAFIDIVDIHFRSAWLYLGEIIGETQTESLIDELFSKFCLGK